ncbi:MAG: response regulator [Clostridiaceae bacterium]|nr:response regulator [Clostridiaceae bacterium]
MSKFSVLVVDDTPANLKVLSAILKEQGCIARTVPTGKLALKSICNNAPDLILLDINMPDMNGYQVCEALKEDETLKNIPVIFISALNETMDKVKAFSVGGVDYITKPFQFEEVQARVETHLKLSFAQKEIEQYNRNLEELVKEKVKELSNSQMSTIFAMAKLAQSRDDDTGKHLERVQNFCKLIAEGLSKRSKYKIIIDDKYIDNIFNASTLHDIGKVGISDNILLKPGRLTTDEFEIMKTHVIIGASTLEEVRKLYRKNSFINMGIAITNSHHEKWDGSGYPSNLSGVAIPLSARIMAIADVYDAIKSKRCYKTAFTHEESCKIIYEGSGKHFDPDIVEVFREINEDVLRTWERFQD